MDINKCQFCEKYYPSSNGTMKCQASRYELVWDNICKEAINKMMTVLTVERCKKEEYHDSTRNS